MQREEIIAAIRAQHRIRCYAMEQRKRTDLSLGSFLRMQLGWRRDLPAPDRARIAKQAAALIAIGEADARGKQIEIDEPAYTEHRSVILSSIMTRAPMDDIERKAKRDMERLAKMLPTLPVVGFGALGLAIITGEAGDLTGYATHSKLWKRMGVAVISGVRQGGLKKNAAAEDWIVHGYNRRRRSRLFTVGVSLIKAKGSYYDLYSDRKEIERTKLPDATKMHIHRRAQRYMEKRLLRDLWKAWRREANEGLPAKWPIS